MNLYKGCVYVWKRGGRALYVGTSYRGIARVFGRHHVIGKVDQIRPGDEIELYWFEQDKDADRGGLERKLILELRPLYNKADLGWRTTATG